MGFLLGFLIRNVVFITEERVAEKGPALHERWLVVDHPRPRYFVPGLTRSTRDSKSKNRLLWESKFLSVQQEYNSLVGSGNRELLETVYGRVMLSQSADPIRDLILEVERMRSMLDVCEDRVLQIDGVQQLLKSILALSHRARALHNSLDEMLCYSIDDISGLEVARRKGEIGCLL